MDAPSRGSCTPKIPRTLANGELTMYTVQGLRQQGFRGRSDSKSGATPRRKASTVSKPSHFSGEVV